jgi:hypothetical protein
VSAFLSGVARAVTHGEGSGWLPGSMALVVVALVLVLVLQRELTRETVTPERDQRVRATRALVVPLLLCALLVLAARLLELIT